jgi:hypothetical protein
MTPDPQVTFWIIPREMLNASQLQFEQQRAFITHSILFGGSLIISDSDFIQNLHLRDAIAQGDKFIVPLIESGYLQFAIRAKNGSPVPFGKTAESLAQSGRNEQIPTGRFTDSPEFRFAEANAQCRHFPVDGAAERYHNETLRILKTTQFNERDVCPNFLKAVHTILDEYVQDNKISWAYFGKRSVFWQRVQMMVPDTPVWDLYGPYLFAVTRGPYATFIPDVLGISPSYSREDQLGVDLWRGRYNLTKEVIERKQLKRARIGLADKIVGLAALSVTDIHTLRCSAEFLAYECACKQLGRGTLFVDEVTIALNAYCNRIDDAVLRALLRNRRGEEFAEEYEISLLRKVGQEVGAVGQFVVRQGVSSALNSTVGGILSVLEFSYQRYQLWHGQDPISEGARQERNKEASKDLELNRLRDSPTLISTVTTQTASIRDIYMSSDNQP